MHIETIGLVVAATTILIVVWQVATAPWYASRTGLGCISLVFGMIQFVTWQPDQALVVSRRGRRLPFLGLDKVGGSKFIFPIVGDRIQYRCDLRITSFSWEFNVLTRESLPCILNVDVWWKVSDIAEFISAAGASKRLNEANPAVSILDTTESRLKSLTDSQVRALVAEASLLQFLASIKTEYRNGPATIAGTSENLAMLSLSVANSLTTSLSRETGRYGVEIDRVAVPGIRFAADIESALMNTWLSHLKPVQAEQEAAAARIHDGQKLDVLEREASVLGRQAIGAREVMKHLPDSKGITLNDPVVSALHAVAHLKGSSNGSEAPPRLPSSNEQPQISKS